MNTKRWVVAGFAGMAALAISAVAFGQQGTSTPKASGTSAASGTRTPGTATTPGAGGGSLQQPQEFHADLKTLNDSGVTGSVTLVQAGANLTVEVKADGLAEGQQHMQHIHQMTDGSTASCPDQSADADGDGTVSLEEGLPSYGPVILPLTQATFPVAGSDGSYAYANQLAANVLAIEWDAIVGRQRFDAGRERYEQQFGHAHAVVERQCFDADRERHERGALGQHRDVEQRYEHERQRGIGESDVRDDTERQRHKQRKRHLAGGRELVDHARERCGRHPRDDGRWQLRPDGTGRLRHDRNGLRRARQRDAVPDERERSHDAGRAAAAARARHQRAGRRRPGRRRAAARRRPR